ncbi:MAG: alginate lyase family protein [Verrucomicrobiales bacterium]|nr:alginate lyase family protein [Verrucomicrobiales bacterium]
MKHITKALYLIRYLGPGWLWFRFWYALARRFGRLERRMPVREWRVDGLAGVLTDPALSSPDAYARYRRARAPRFFFATADRARLGPILRQWDSAEANPIRAAERFLAGEFCFFEKTWHDCGNPPDWFLDPFMGRRLKSDAHWSRIDTFSGGDIKCIWELSRFGFAYTLVRAYWRDGDERWPELFWKLVEDWRAKNPPNRGPQWMCGQEAAFRVMAWCFSWQAFADSPATTPKREAMLLEMLARSGERIAANIGYALSQENNHGISEAVGLWTLGTLFPELQAAARWEARGRSLLERLARELIYDDGGFSQHSANYHRVMLQDFSWALRLADLLDRPFSDALKRRVCGAVDFLYQLQDGISGGVPCFGGNDGALVLPLSPCDYTDFRPALQAANLVLGRGRLYPAGPWDEESLWLMGVGVAESGQPEFPKRRSFAAEQAGYYTLRGEESFAVIHCPRRFRHRPAHADLLHVDLWWRGVNVAADPGTYSYNAPPPWKHGFRNTRFHNTVTVDGADQMESAGRFLWLPWVEGKPAGRISSADPDMTGWRGAIEVVAGNGRRYRHERSVFLLNPLGWVVLDEVATARIASIQLNWLLPLEAGQVGGDGARVMFEAGGRALAVSAGAFEERGSAVVSKGTADASFGWRSAYYQRLDPGVGLRLEVTGSMARFWTHFGPAETAVSAGKEGLTLQDADEAVGVCREAGGGWRVSRTGTGDVEAEELRRSSCTRC